jgi:hypothetical protein
MVLLDRPEGRTIPLDVYFSFKINFKLEFFQNVIRPGTLKPWIPSRRRFPAEQNTHVVLYMKRIPPEQKKPGFLRCSAYLEYRQSKNQTVCSPENSPLCRNRNTAGAVLPGTP